MRWYSGRRGHQGQVGAACTVSGGDIDCRQYYGRGWAVTVQQHTGGQLCGHCVTGSEPTCAIIAAPTTTATSAITTIAITAATIHATAINTSSVSTTATTAILVDVWLSYQDTR